MDEKVYLKIVLLVGTAMMSMTAAFIAWFSVFTSRKIRKAHADKTLLSDSLLKELRHLKSKYHNLNLDKENLINYFLEQLLQLIQTINHEALIASGKSDEWEKMIVALYENLHQQLRELKTSTFYLKNLHLPLNSLIEQYVSVLNKNTGSEITCLVESQSNNVELKNNLWNILPIITALAGQKPCVISISENEDSINLYVNNFMKEDENQNKLKILVKAMQGKMTSDEHFIYITLPVSNQKETVL